MAMMMNPQFGAGYGTRPGGMGMGAGMPNMSDPWMWVQLGAMLSIPGAIQFVQERQAIVPLYIDQFIRKMRGETVRTISFTYSTDYWFNHSQDDRNNILQKALTMYIADNCKRSIMRLRDGRMLMVNSDDTTRSWGDEDESLTSKDLRKMKFSPMPARGDWQEVEPGLRFKYTETPDENASFGEQRMIHAYSLAAYGRESKAKIDDFIDRAYRNYVNVLKKEEDTSRYLYQMQIKDAFGEGAKKPPVYKKYKLTDDKTFDSLFFEGKNEILTLVDDFVAKRGKFAIEGFPNKLGLLLHGPPGTGKTSFVKALATHTNRHIVTVPLAKINTNQDLYDIMFELVFPTVDDEGVNQQLTFRDVIFLMEDIDASAEVVKSRKQTEADEKNETHAMMMMQMMLLAEAKQNKGTGSGDAAGGEAKKDAAADSAAGGFDLGPTDYSKILGKADKLDLAGLLNVLDGVVDSPGRIVIMTTNHPEALDAALVRPGRINTKLHMDYMTDNNVIDMFRHHFGSDCTPAVEAKIREILIQKRAFNTHGFKMSGAEVEQLCAECDDAAEFIEELEAYPRLHKDLRAQIADYQ